MWFVCSAVSVASDWKFKKKRQCCIVLYVIDPGVTAEADKGLLGIRCNTPNKMCIIQLVSDGPNGGDISVRKYLANSIKNGLTMLLQLGRDQRQSSTIINEMHSF